MKLHTLLKNIYPTDNIPDCAIADLVYDSRKAADGTLFCALCGAYADGHDYAQKAYDNGCRVFAVEHKVDLPDDAQQLIFEDTRAALAQLSCNFFNHPANEMAVVGITGTKGKTTVTNMLRSVFDGCGILSGVIGTIGAFWGDKAEKTVNTTPESYEIQRLLRKMADDGCKAVFIEISSLGLKQHRSDGILFDTAVFTNLSPDHIGGTEHESFEEYAYWKKQLFKQCKRAVLNADDAFCADFKKELNCPVVTFSMEKTEADFSADDITFIRTDKLSMGFTLMHDGISDRCTVGMPGIFSVYNALTAIAVAHGLGIDKKTVFTALENAFVKGRMQPVAVDGDFDILIDYAHNGLSFKSVIETVKAYNPTRMIALYGCVGGRAQVRRKEMGMISGALCDLSVISTDDPQYEDPAVIAEEVAGYVRQAGGDYVIIVDRAEAIRYCLDNAQSGDIILLLGKGHEEYMKVNGETVPFSERAVIEEYFNRK